MLEDPEFEPEFYAQQIGKMEKRYALHFKQWGLSWKEYYKYVTKALDNKPYWVWVYLCGFEKFLQEDGQIAKHRKEKLYKDADARIRRIIGDFYKIREYMKTI